MTLSAPLIKTSAEKTPLVQEWVQVRGRLLVNLVAAKALFVDGSNLFRQLIKTFFSRAQNQQGQNPACNEPHGDMDGFLRDGVSDA